MTEHDDGKIPDALADALTDSVAKGARMIRNVAFNIAADMCDELHREGFDAAMCAVAIRRMRDTIDASIEGKASSSEKVH